jgi:hypothetical protein
MARPNKLEGLSLETLSSQVFEFEGKARANPIGVPFRCFLVLPANVRLDWKVIARCKDSSLFGFIISNKGKKFYNIGTRCQRLHYFFSPSLILQLTKLECLSHETIFRVVLRLRVRERAYPRYQHH